MRACERVLGLLARAEDNKRQRARRKKEEFCKRREERVTDIEWK